MEKLLYEFVNKSKEILGDNLTGIYLHGSAVMGCFNPKKSDIDFIVVTIEKMDNASKRAFMDMVVESNEGGEWGLENLPGKYHTIISTALREYLQGTDLTYDNDLAKEYAKYMIEQISKNGSGDKKNVT